MDNMAKAIVEQRQSTEQNGRIGRTKTPPNHHHPRHRADAGYIEKTGQTRKITQVERYGTRQERRISWTSRDDFEYRNVTFSGRTSSATMMIEPRRPCGTSTLSEPLRDSGSMGSGVGSLTTGTDGRTSFCPSTLMSGMDSCFLTEGFRSIFSGSLTEGLRLGAYKECWSVVSYMTNMLFLTFVKEEK